MPTYEYRCKACSRELEVVQSFTDDALTTCEACGGQLRKMFGNVGIAFKGSGFYKNDSRGKATNGVAATTEKAGTDKGSSDAGSADKSTTKDSGSGGTTKDTSSGTKKDTGASGTGSSSKGEAAKSSPKSA